MDHFFCAAAEHGHAEHLVSLAVRNDLYESACVANGARARDHRHGDGAAPTRVPGPHRLLFGHADDGARWVNEDGTRDNAVAHASLWFNGEDVVGREGA